MNKEPNFIINPKTGRRVASDGVLGKKLLKASSTINKSIKMKIARKAVEKAKAEAPPAPPAPKPNPMGGMAKGGRKKLEVQPKNNLPELPRDIWKKVMKQVYKDGWDFDEGWNKLSMKFMIRPHYMSYSLANRKMIKEEDETGVYHKQLDNHYHKTDMTDIIKLIVGYKMYDQEKDKYNKYLENWLIKYQPECIKDYKEYEEHRDRWEKVKFKNKFNFDRAKVYYEWIKYDPKNVMFKSAKYADIQDKWADKIKYHYKDKVNVDDYKKLTELYLVRLTDTNGNSIPEAIIQYFLYSKEEKAFLALIHDQRHRFVEMMFNYGKKGNGEMRAKKRTETKRWYNQSQDYDIIYSPLELELFKKPKKA